MPLGCMYPLHCAGHLGFLVPLVLRLETAAFGRVYSALTQLQLELELLKV